MVRLFVGLELPEEVRDALYALRRHVSGGRWLPPENLHLTLRFIGNVDLDLARDIDDELARVAAPCFALTLRSVGHFGAGKAGGILWAGVGGHDPLMRLARRVDRAVDRVPGVGPRDKPFRPHITLARLKRAPAAQVAQFLAAEAAFALGPIPVTRFTLFSSTLGRDGAHYRAEADYALSLPGADRDADAALSC